MLIIFISIFLICYNSHPPNIKHHLNGTKICMFIPCKTTISGGCLITGDGISFDPIFLAQSRDTTNFRRHLLVGGFKHFSTLIFLPLTMWFKRLAVSVGAARAVQPASAVNICVKLWTVLNGDEVGARGSTVGAGTASGRGNPARFAKRHHRRPANRRR